MKFSTLPAVYWWQPAAWLRVTGSDAATFLQGQFTNDLRVLPREPAVYGLWLNVKGKVVADSFVLRGAAAGADEFWVGSYFSAASVIRERLENFVIADDVVIEDATVDWAGVTIFGEGVWPVVKAESVEGRLFRGRRSRGASVEWIFPTAARESIRAQLGDGREVVADEVARWRIEAGIPAVPADLGPGDLPNEGGLEGDAISYTKGCYLGQEVMARLKSMGQVRRRLVRVALATEKIPELPAPLFLGARQIGELRSAAPDGAGGHVGLAMVSLLHVTAGVQLAFAPDGSPNITVAVLP